MTEKLRAKLKKEGRTFRWFLSEYLPDKYYSTFMLQINGFTNLQPDVEKAIEKYLKDKD